MATPKHADDRPLRAVRNTGTARRTANRRKHLPNMSGKVALRNKGSKKRNNPKRGGGHIKTELRAGLKECTQFLGQYINGDIGEFKKAIKSFSHKEELRNFIDHLVAVSEDGWKLKDGRLIHESGREASLKNWSLISNRVCPKGKGPINFKSGWLMEARMEL